MFKSIRLKRINKEIRHLYLHLMKLRKKVRQLEIEIDDFNIDEMLPYITILEHEIEKTKKLINEYKTKRERIKA